MKKKSLKLLCAYGTLCGVLYQNTHAGEIAVSHAASLSDEYAGNGVGGIVREHPYLSAAAGIATVYGAWHHFSRHPKRFIDVDGEKVALPVTYSQEFCARFDEVFAQLASKKEGEKFFIINYAVELRTKRPEGKCKILYFSDDQGKRHMIVRFLQDGSERRYNVQFLSEKEMNALLVHLRLYVSDNREEAQWGILRLRQILRLSEGQALTPAAVLQKFSWFCDQDKELQEHIRDSEDLG